MTEGKMIGGILLLLLLPLAALAQQEMKKESKADVWQPLRFFVGSWEGASKGQPGNASQVDPMIALRCD